MSHSLNSASYSICQACLLLEACSRAHYRRYLLHIIHAATHYQRSLRSFVVFPRANGRAASATPTKFAAVGSSASSELSTANLYGVLSRDGCTGIGVVVPRRFWHLGVARMHIIGNPPEP